MRSGPPNSVEHIIIDGGSSDNTLEIIRRYADALVYWVSEPDRGQSHAINKGFSRSTGDILCWLNSDDYFLDDSLSYVSHFFEINRDADVLCGGVRLVNADGDLLFELPAKFEGREQLIRYWHGYHMHQPSIFWRRRVYETIGGVNERLHLSMDYDYWIRMAARFEIHVVDRPLSNATLHSDQKTADGFVGYRRAQLRNIAHYLGSPFSIRDWPLRLMFYRHLIGSGARIILRRPNVYGL